MALLFFCLFVSFALCAIPVALPGVALTAPPMAASVLEVFYDAQCPDSKANVPVLEKVLEEFGQRISVRHLMYPLVFHRNSHIACAAVLAVAAIEPLRYLSLSRCFLSLSLSHHSSSVISVL